MQQELDFLVQACAKRGIPAIESSAGRLPIVQFPDLDMILARGGVGKAQFAVQTQHLLDSCVNLQLVICAGAAGALADDLFVGDVVVATSTIEHDYGNKFTSRPFPRFEGSESAIDVLRGVSPSSGSFQVHFGPIASGDEDIVDKERRAIVRHSTGALAVAWEGAGGARACAFSNVPFVEIRGVTDTADDDAPADFRTNLELAMTNVAALIIAWRIEGV
jgi:adenosylhomocysteine nucleosidase